MFGGIYAAFFTGFSGNSFGLFMFANGTIVGADAGGATYDGQYAEEADGLHIAGSITLRGSAGISLITGMTAGPAGISMPVPIRLPMNFDEHQVFRIDTPVGTVNARFKKLRGVP